MAEQHLRLWDGDPTGAVNWTANAADGSSARLSVDAREGGVALRLDYTLGGHGSWVIVRRELAAELPPHYVAIVTLRGEGGGPVELQLKLVDPSGANVWWWRRAAFTAPPQRADLVLHKASLEFAWGPASGGDPSRIGAVELALAGGEQPSQGTLWIEGLCIEARDPASARPVVQVMRASTAADGHAAERAHEADPKSTWCPAAGDAEPWIELDFGRRCEFGGVVVDFAAAPVACRLLASDGGTGWTELAAASEPTASRIWLRTAVGDAARARIQFSAGGMPRVARVDVVPLDLAVSPARYMSAIAKRAPRGRYPRHLLDEQIYWALVGADGDARKGLLSEDGALEIDAESFTLEPFIWADGQLITWADVQSTVTLADGHLPIPTVEWRATDLRLRITAGAAGPAARSALVVRYAVEDTRGAARRLRLFVAVRPYQVNPAWQSLNLVGGVAPISRLRCETAVVEVNGARRVVAVSRPDHVGAAPAADGLSALGSGEVPAAARLDDPIGFAEAAFRFDLTLEPGAAASVAVAVPLHDATPAPPAALDPAAAAAWVDEQLAAVQTAWRARLARVPIELPAGAARFTDTVRASLAWILINREGPRIQPGPRCYRRSWIRDGTMTGGALAEMGFADELPAFLRWYAPFQLADGRVPCAVDHRGIDHAVEHDSHGQLIWGIVESFRLTGDHAFLRELWPHAVRAIDAIAALRAQRTTDAYRGTAAHGLLPESISHEGYASHPVHSYWDDFFAVRGLADAADAAVVLGDTATAERAIALRDAMRADLHASIARTIEQHGIDFIPGSVELGDFDPTSTAIAFDPCAEAARLPAAALTRTFDRYWTELEARRRGDVKNEAYTPYEVRTAAALLMLGQPERARALLEWLIDDQRLAPWCEWPEIAWHDRRAPRFFGDLPHGWVASSFLRALRRLIAYERDDGALVIAAGVAEAWVREAPGVRVRALPTHFGHLDYTMCADGGDRVVVTLGGDVRPPGGIVIVSPFDRPMRGAMVDGQEKPVAHPDRLALHEPVSNAILVY